MDLGPVGFDKESMRLDVARSHAPQLFRDAAGVFGGEEAESDGETLAELLETLDEANRTIVVALAGVMEAKDPQLRPHLERAFRYAKALSFRVDPRLSESREVAYGFLLHDIGKAAIPATLLAKEGPLTSGEWEVMRRHPAIGGVMIAGIGSLVEAAPVIEGHHERWDGNGYPRGLKGTEIPLAARVFALADAFDAMTSDRPYRRALPLDRALEEIHRETGSQFDPELAETFLAMDWRQAPTSG